MSPQKRSLVLRLLRDLVLLAICSGALAGSTAASIYFMKNRPKPQRRRPARTAALVEAQEVYSATHQVIVRANGTVFPAVEVTLQPQVTGQIVEIHPHFLEGGLVREGDVLVRIEPKDYELAIVSQEAHLETARYELKAEDGQQDVAQREWELLGMGEEASALDRELALRQPQLRQKRTGLRAAEAQLEKARLDLARTVIKAPCNGIIRSADVRVGDLAAAQTPLATLVGTDAYWVRLTIAVDRLKWIQLPDTTGEPASAVRLHTGTGAVREGRVLSLLSDLEPQGRLARLLVEVRDPLGLEAGGKQAPLLLGEYVEDAEIIGRTVEDVFVVPQEALRDGNRLWLASADNTLHILEAEIVWTDRRCAVLRGLGEGDRVIVSDVATPIEGLSIQLREDAAKGSHDESEGTSDVAGDNRGAQL